MSLAGRIRASRYAKGWGPDELASRASISRTALYQIECGKTEAPRAGTLRRIAQALDVPIDALLGRSGGDVAPAAPRPGRAPAEPSKAPTRESEVERKFHELLASPLGESVARLVEESHRMLPAMRTG